MKLADTIILLEMVGRTVMVLLSSTVKECFGKLLLPPASEERALLPTELQNVIKCLRFAFKFWQGSNALIFQKLIGMYPEIHKNSHNLCMWKRSYMFSFSAEVCHMFNSSQVSS